MAIKETPTNFRVYYGLMREANNKRLDELIEEKDKLENEVRQLFEKLNDNVDNYKNIFNIDLTSYKEFNENKYINGEYYKDAKGLFMNRRGDYKIENDLYSIFDHARKQEMIHNCEKEMSRCNNLLALSLKDYNNLLKLYFTEVHKKLVLEGCGYSFGEGIGWICVNRFICKRKIKKSIDFAATKKREAELKAQGKRIWNKEEAEWCKANNIEYIAEDKRVFRNTEYEYEIPLINSKLPCAWDLKLTISDYRHTSLRGKTNDDLIKDCDSNINKICELPIDVKTKVTLCNKVDKILYNKYIRNEAQKSITVGKANSKNRQRL